MDVVFLLDRSGSMQGIEQDTIGGYNSYIESQKNNNIKVTTVLFDDKYEMITDRVAIKDIKKLTNKEYYVRGCTALMDAIGKTIAYIDNKAKNKAIFIITTDGMENASKEYNKNKIKQLIENHSNWEFMYIGANIDSYAESSLIGIKKENTANYKKDSKGVSTLFNSISRASSMYMSNDYIADSWKDELENYIEENKK